MGQEKPCNNHYTKENSSSDYRKEIFRIMCIKGDPEYIDRVLSLPISVDQMEAIADQNGKLAFLQSRTFNFQYVPESDGMDDYLPPFRSVEELNQIACAMQEICQNGCYHKKELFAFLEAEIPEDTDAVIKIIKDYEDYQLLPWDYYQRANTEYLWERSGVSRSHDKQNFTDSEYLEKEWLRQNGIIKTEFGYVRNQKRPLVRNEEESTFSLYSPIILLLYENKRTEPVPVLLAGEEEVGYQTVIQARIEESLEECGPQGLEVYLANQLLKQKVKAMMPHTEIVNQKLYLVLRVDLNQPLTDSEYQQLVNEWTLQAEHGWGLEFFEQAINVPEGELFAVFWESDDALHFTIETERELFGHAAQRELM